MPKFKIALVVLTLGALAYWMLSDQETIQKTLGRHLERSPILTLKAYYTPEMIQEKQGTDTEPLLTFYPYLLMEVQYLTSTQKLQEGMLLWSTVDGEMVLDTATWETTDGFDKVLRGQAKVAEMRELIPEVPRTKIRQWLATKPYNHARKARRNFSQEEIKVVAEEAFGQDFTIRSIRKIYLPIYTFENGSQWNGLNGEPVQGKLLTYIH